MRGLHMIACTCVLLLLHLHDLEAQNIIGQPVLDYNTKAPEVQQMKKFIDAPVSMFTGTPDINIPVYTISTKSINANISLRYASGGIKAEDEASRVGLGWQLEVGGSITRSIRGTEDEGIRRETKPHRFTKTTAPYFYYLWNNSRDSLSKATNRYGGFYADGGSGLSTVSNLYNIISSHNNYLFQGQVPPSSENVSLPSFFNGLDDDEPDMFYFNFGGYSGKFIFGLNKTPIIIPYTQDIKIVPVFKNASDTVVNVPGSDTTFYAQYYFESFVLSTQDGKDYYFGENEASRYQTPYNGKPRMYTGWNLTRIVDRIGMDTVYFTYTPNNGAGNLALQNVQKFVTPEDVADGCVNTLHLLVRPQSNSQPLVSKVTSSKEELYFYGGLDSIKVFDRISGIAYKKLQFDFGKFLSGRKKLLGFTTKDLLSNQFSPYTFTYYDTAGYKGRSAQDYWGYHNGASNNNKLFTGYTGCTDSAANRQSAWPAMKIDALTEITYPTGGKVVFEYEPHRANTGRKLDNSIQSGDAFFVGQGLNFEISDMIGGLRVKKITHIDPIKKDTIQKSYYYQEFGSTISSGFLHIPPAFALDCSTFACNSSNSSDKPTRYLSTHNLYTGSGTGPHMSYNNVTVREEKNGKNNGRIEYEFYDDTNTDSEFYSNALTATTNYPIVNSTDIFPSWQFRRLPENFLDGREKEQRTYDSAGNLLLRQRSLYKSLVYSTPVYGKVVNTVLKQDICNTAIPSPAAAGASGWGNRLGDLGVGLTVNYHIDDTQYSMENDDFFSDVWVAGPGIHPILPPTLSYYFFYSYSYNKIAVLKDRDIKESYPSATSYIIDTTIYSYENNTHLNPTAITTRNSKGSVLKQQNLYSYDFNNVNNGDSTINFMKKAFLNLPVAGFNYINSNIVSGGYRTYKLKSRADSTIALPSEEYSLDVNAAGIAPATLNISSTFPMALNFPPASFQKVATYKYNANNTLSHVIKEGNEKVSLLWDYNKNFMVAQVVNADSANIAFTSFETVYNGNWSIASTIRNTITAVTGKKSYSLTSGNITKNGLSAALVYKVSYWSASSAATVNSVAGVAGNTENGWTYYEHTLPVSTTSVTISGTVIIDELRLYPENSQMTSYTFEPLFGVTSINTVNNTIAYYEYDGQGKLRFIKDADRNIVKNIQYFESGFGSDTSVWRSSGTNTRLKVCAANSAYTTNIVQNEQVNINPNSSTYGSLRWADGNICTSCVITAWQNTATALRCQKNGSNENTGQQEQEQKDMNPCSPTGNTLRWVVSGTNTTACPLPVSCTGNDKMIINGVCVTGTKIYTASVFNQSMNQWSCKYHYEWPGCIKSIDYYEYKPTSCGTTNGCVPD